MVPDYAHRIGPRATKKRTELCSFFLKLNFCRGPDCSKSHICMHVTSLMIGCFWVRWAQDIMQPGLCVLALAQLKNMYDNVTVLVLKNLNASLCVHAAWVARGMWAPNQKLRIAIGGQLVSWFGVCILGYGSKSQLGGAFMICYLITRSSPHFAVPGRCHDKIHSYPFVT